MKKYINTLYVTNNGKFEIDNGYIKEFINRLKIIYGPVPEIDQKYIGDGLKVLYVADQLYDHMNLFMMKYYGLEIAGPVYIVNKIPICFTYFDIFWREQYICSNKDFDQKQH